MLQLRLAAFAFFFGLSAIACSGETNTPNGSGGSGSGGRGGSGSGGAGGSDRRRGRRRGGTTGDSGACPKFDYTNYNPTRVADAEERHSADLHDLVRALELVPPERQQPSSESRPLVAQLDGGKPSDMVLQGILTELDKPSIEVAGRRIIVSGKPEDSWLVNKIEGTHDCSGFTCMLRPRTQVRDSDARSPDSPGEAPDRADSRLDQEGHGVVGSFGVASIVGAPPEMIATRERRLS